MYLISPPKNVADILCASSHTMRSQRQSGTASLACTSSLRESLSRRAMARLVSKNQLPVRAASSLSFVRISNGKLKRRYNSSCHCSASMPGHTIRHRWRSPRAINSLISRPAMMVLPAPGSSASRNLQGLPRQHRPVDSSDLVGQRLDQRGVHGEQRVEEVGEADPVGLRRPVETGAPSPSKLQGRPCSTTSIRGSSWRYSSSFATLPAAVL